MAPDDARPRLRLFRDGRFLDDGTAAAVPAPPLAPDSLPSRLLGCGCLAAVVLAVLLVALVAGLFALVSGAGEERTSTTGVVRSVGPGTDDDGVRHEHCYEVAYTAGGRDLLHRTCEVTPRASVDLADDEPGPQRDARFAAAHGVGSEVRLRHAVDPPYAGSGAIADLDGTLLQPGRTASVVGWLVAGSALSFAASVLWLALRGRRRPVG